MARLGSTYASTTRNIRGQQILLTALQLAQCWPGLRKIRLVGRTRTPYWNVKVVVTLLCQSLASTAQTRHTRASQARCVAAYICAWKTAQLSMLWVPLAASCCSRLQFIVIFCKRRACVQGLQQLLHLPQSCIHFLAVPDELLPALTCTPECIQRLTCCFGLPLWNA